MDTPEALWRIARAHAEGATRAAAVVSTGADSRANAYALGARIAAELIGEALGQPSSDEVAEG